MDQVFPKDNDKVADLAIIPERVSYDGAVFTILNNKHLRFDSIVQAKKEDIPVLVKFLMERLRITKRLAMLIIRSAENDGAFI